MLLKRVWSILETARTDHTFIGKMKYSPDKNSIIVDINYGKALRISAQDNVIHVQGDLSIGEKVKKIIEGAIQDGNKCK